MRGFPPLPAASLLAAALLAGGLSAMPASADAEFRVIGYFESRHSVRAIRYDHLTHINFAFILPTTEGGITGPGEDDLEKLDEIVEIAHTAGIEVYVSVGGWNGGDSGAFRIVSSDERLRVRFVSTVLAFVMAHDLDGVDVDWEFPSGHEGAFISLLSEFRDALSSAGKGLTAAVYGWDSLGVTAEAFDYVDWLNIMSYDGGTPHSSMELARSSVRYWMEMGLPARKMNLGVPFYGRNEAWKSRWYRRLAAADPGAPFRDEGGHEQVNGYFYNSIPTVKRKVRLARDSGLGGIHIWEIGLDAVGDASLLRAIAEEAAAQEEGAGK